MPVNTTCFSRRDVVGDELYEAKPFAVAHKVVATDAVRRRGLTLENGLLRVTLSEDGRVDSVIHLAAEVAP